MRARGYAIANSGEIDIRTVSGTRRAAIVNWLVAQAGVMVFAYWTDERIEDAWVQESARVPGVEIIQVRVEKHDG